MSVRKSDRRSYPVYLRKPNPHPDPLRCHIATDVLTIDALATELIQQNRV